MEPNEKNKTASTVDQFGGLDPSELPEDLVGFILETKAVIVDWEDLTTPNSEIKH